MVLFSVLAKGVMPVTPLPNKSVINYKKKKLALYAG
jgi:hypothetical protein